MSKDNADRYIELFLEESTEQIDLLNDSLLRLEQEGAIPDVVNELFRSAHTLKSSAAFVGQDRLSELAHRMEDLLQQVRDGSLQINTEVVNLFFRCVDRIRNTLVQISAGETVVDDFEDLKTAIRDYARNEDNRLDDTVGVYKGEKIPEFEQSSADSDMAVESSAEQSAAVSKKTPDAVELRQIELTEEETEQLQRVSAGMPVYFGIVSLDQETAMRNMRYLLLLENLRRELNVFKSMPADDELEGDSPVDALRFVVYGNISQENLIKHCQIDMVEEVRVYEHKIGQALATVASESGGSQHQETRLQSKNIKVASEKIDYLMNNMGELVIINSGLQKVYDDLTEVYGEDGALNELKSKIDQAVRNARDLQSGIMKMRMIPVSLVFHRFTRPVRDLAHELGKEVRLEFHGEDTELDKNIIDSLNEPLLHLLRNAIDHGIEGAEERFARGKDPVARIQMSAFQSGNNVLIEVRDDGRGLNRQRILEKARESGVIAYNTAEQDLQEEEIFDLIFQPGFSTAIEVSDVSGRGVGMNVVRQMVEGFKGAVQVISKEGEGTTFQLSFPLTLAIVSAILVQIGDEEYAFPLADVVETIKVVRDEVTSLQGKDIINLRGDILPVFRLSTLMGLPTDDDREEFPILIASSANRKVGFIVDRLVGKTEIVIKSLEQNFRRIRGLIGACLMGDGRIILVLDVQGLLDLAQRSEKDEITDADRSLADQVQAVNTFVNRKSGLTRTRAVRKVHARTAEDSSSADTITLERPDENGRTSRRLPGVEPIEATPLADIQSQVGGDFATGAGSRSFGGGSDLNGDLNGSPDRNAGIESDFNARTAASTTARNDRAVSGADLEAAEHVLATPEPSDGADIVVPSEERAAPLRELSDADYNHLFGLITEGMQNSGKVLSQLLGVHVDVSVPEFRTIEYSELKEQFSGNVFSVTVAMEGGMEGHSLLIFDETTGYRAAADLMGYSGDAIQDLSAEDVQSVLSELANIVSSGLFNELSNRTGLTIMPGVPDYMHGDYHTVITSLQQGAGGMQPVKILYITTDFFRKDLEFLGRLLVVPTAQSLARVLNKL
ncbi:MAG: chemotaxis protein CheW [Leptospiraceae bacterium]|nr:chemotaxis protein CheW [Leptospiraceae bacterium]